MIFSPSSPEGSANRIFPFSDSDGESNPSGHAPTGGGSNPTGHASTPPVVQSPAATRPEPKICVWKDERKKKFVTDLLYKEGHSQSSRALADRYGIDRSQQLPLLIIAVAQCIIDVKMSAWREFLLFLIELKREGKIECLRFTWFVMSDETPTRNKVHDIGEEGEVEQNVQIAKVMASQTKFSLIFRVLGNNSDGVSEPVAPYCIAHGELPTMLQGMENQTAGVVLRTLKVQTAPPEMGLLATLFIELHRFDNTDLHASMLAALRQEAIDAPSWHHGHIRCSVHRIRSAELYALGADSPCDSFFLNLTLSLRSSGVMTVFKRRVRAWLRRIPIRVYQGEPPEDTVRWRERVIGGFRRRVECGNASMHEVSLLHAWDVYFTGDGRRMDEIQHYHTNYCTKDDELCFARCRRDGFAIVLRKQPKKYSRRTWHGHMVSVDQIIFWESLHGMLSQNYGDVVTQAAARAAHARAARAAAAAAAAAAASSASVPARPDRGVSEPVAPGIAGIEENDLAELLPGVAAQARECKYAEEEAARSRTVLSFLQRGDRLRRMLLYRCFMGFVSEARVPVLQRAAPEWDAKQSARLRQEGCRDFRLPAAFRAENLHQALEKISTFVASHLHSMVLQSPSYEVGSADENLLCFRMGSRAGGALLEMGILEQRRSPFLLHALLGAGGQSQMEVFAEDALMERKYSSHAFDGSSAAHIDAHPSIQELTSKESLAKLESQDIIAEETTVLVERGHAEVKRGQGSEERGHTQKLMQDSAMRVIRMLRCEQDLGWAGRLRKAAQSNGVPKPMAPRRRPRAQTQKKSRARTAWQAWAHKHKRCFLKRQDIRECMEAVRDPEVNREYTELGKLLRAVGPRKRVYDRRLRTMRERCKFAGTTWNLEAARAKLLEEDRRGFEREKQRRARQHRAVRRQQREQETEAQDALAKALATEVFENPLIQDCLKDCPGLVPRPVVHADAGYVWVPDVRSIVIDKLPGILQHHSLDTLIRWTRGHEVIKRENAAVVKKETASGKRQRLCYEAGQCLCRTAGGRHMRIVALFHKCLGHVLRKPKNKPLGEVRLVADVGDLVICVSSALSTLWAHVAFPRYQPFGLVLLRLRRVEDPESKLGPNRVALQVSWQPVVGGSLSWRWCTSTEFMKACCPDHAYSVTFWKLVQVEAERGDVIKLESQHMAQVAWPFWGRALGEAGVDEPDEDQEEEREEAQDLLNCSRYFNDIIHGLVSVVCVVRGIGVADVSFVWLRSGLISPLARIVILAAAAMRRARAATRACLIGPRIKMWMTSIRSAMVFQSPLHTRMLNKRRAAKHRGSDLLCPAIRPREQVFRVMSNVP